MKRIAGLSYNRAGNALLTIECERAWADQIAEAVQDREIAVDIKEYRERRSKNANAYSWLLQQKIANAIGSTADAVHLQCLYDYGQSQIVSVVDGVPLEAYFQYYKIVGTGVLNGKKFNHVRVFKPTHLMDVAEMSCFLDGVVEEAKELGIPTETPEEIEKMKARWGEQVFDIDKEKRA